MPAIISWDSGRRFNNLRMIWAGPIVLICRLVYPYQQHTNSPDQCAVSISSGFVEASSLIRISPAGVQPEWKTFTLFQARAGFITPKETFVTICTICKFVSSKPLKDFSFSVCRFVDWIYISTTSSKLWRWKTTLSPFIVLRSVVYY